MRFTAGGSTCIQPRMTKVLTVRIAPELLGRAEAGAARLGLDRTGYVKSLIERDLQNPDPIPTRRFVSEDLAGTFRFGGLSATNLRTRERPSQGRCLHRAPVGALPPVQGMDRGSKGFHGLSASRTTAHPLRLSTILLGLRVSHAVP